MAPRSRHRPQRTHYDVDATITPETGLKVSFKQMAGIIGGIFFVAIGYAYLTYNVVDIKDKQVAAIATTSAAIKDQDEKRTELGKKFLDSNEKIAAAVTTLATQMAVQQERQKSTDEKLEKVLTQISTTLSPAGSRR